MSRHVPAPRPWSDPTDIDDAEAHAWRAVHDAYDRGEIHVLDGPAYQRADADLAAACDWSRYAHEHRGGVVGPVPSPKRLCAVCVDG